MLPPYFSGRETWRDSAFLKMMYLQYSRMGLFSATLAGQKAFSTFLLISAVLSWTKIEDSGLLLLILLAISLSIEAFSAYPSNPLAPRRLITHWWRTATGV